MERSRPSSTQDLKQTYIVGQLDNIPEVPGGQTHLLPKEVVEQTFKVWFPIWPESNPSTSSPETVELYWNDERVDFKKWTSTVPSEDLFIEVTTNTLIEGTNRLYY